MEQGKGSSCLKEVVGEVQEEMGSLHSIRCYRKEDRIFSRTLNTQWHSRKKIQSLYSVGWGKKTPVMEKAVSG